MTSPGGGGGAGGGTGGAGGGNGTGPGGIGAAVTAAQVSATAALMANMSSVIEVDESNVDDVCDNIAQEAVEQAISHMMSMCGNAGQEAIIGDSSDALYDEVETISAGEIPEWEPDHIDAVYIIADEGMQICADAAEQCAQIRAITELIAAGSGGAEAG